VYLSILADTCRQSKHQYCGIIPSADSHSSNPEAGLAKADKVTRTIKINKRSLAQHAYRCRELIRRKIARDGKASLNFFILASRKSIKIDYSASYFQD
jgi:hypothetical protein